MQRNWIISNAYKPEVYAFLKRNHITFEPSGCYDDSTCIAAWNLTIHQLYAIEHFIIENHYGYCMDRVPLPIMS